MSMQDPKLPATLQKVAQKSMRLLPGVDRLGHAMGGDEPFREGDEIGGRAVRFGLWVLGISMGALVLWSIAAPIDSAAVARGVVVLDSNKKTVQHLEGGIVDKILVHEGKFVQAGEVLIELNPANADARLGMVAGQYWAEKAAAARLAAERDGKQSIDFPKDLLEEAAKNPAVQDTIDSQTKLFETRSKSLSGSVDVLNQQIEQLKNEIAGLRAQEQSAASQGRLLEEELVGMRKLLASGNASKSRVLALERQAADLKGRRGDYLAQIARAQQRISETNIEILNTKNKYMNDVATSTRETQVRMGTLEEQKNAASDISDRLLIKAPVTGIVTNLRIHTKGGVIAPGEAVLDLVPQNERLIVEAQVSPQDIDVVHQGLTARVRLSAYKTRNLHPVEGEVTTVSPDRFVDEKTGQSYFLARIIVDPKQFDKLGNVKLYPGMPADVLIVTGSRSLIGYLLQPIKDSMFRAFREQ
jgi:HlyD family type I secretion membrane fusion protein